MGNKPKNNDKNPAKDRCQTPLYALEPLLEYLRAFDVIWEPAAGEGRLQHGLESAGFTVLYSDILSGMDYFTYEAEGYECQVTNPPFSRKYEWLERAYQLGKPFALLMPSDVLFAKRAQRLFQRYGVGILLPDRRIDFKMPNNGWSGTAQMHTSWFTWGLEVPEMIHFVTLEKPDKKRLLEIEEGIAPIRRVQPQKIAPIQLSYL